MSADREELARLARELPDENVAVVLAVARRRLTPAEPRPWPPALFGSIRSQRDDDPERVDEVLAKGFGGGAR